MTARALVGVVALLAALRVAAAPIDVNLSLNSGPFGGSTSFAGILREGENSPEVGVILLHGRGGNPNSNNVVRPLRFSLSDLGYTTLSIALPVPPDTTGNGDPTDFQDYVNDLTGVMPPERVLPALRPRARRRARACNARRRAGRAPVQLAPAWAPPTRARRRRRAAETLTSASAYTDSRTAHYGRHAGRGRRSVLDIYGSLDTFAVWALPLGRCVWRRPARPTPDRSSAVRHAAGHDATSSTTERDPRIRSTRRRCLEVATG
jgi:hypothetical protein